MRKALLAVVGIALSACGGGGEESQPPKTPATPVATETTAPTTPSTAEAPKETKPQASPAELQAATGKGIQEAMNAHDAKKLSSFYTQDAVMHAIGMPEIKGRDAIATEMGKMFTGFPDTKTAATRIWMKGDVGVVEWVMNGTNKGEMHGMKATEKPIGLAGVSVMWFTPEGLVKEEHVYHDVGTMMSQMGLSKQKVRPIPAIPTAAPQVFTSNGSADETKNAEASKSWMKAFETKKDTDFVAPLADNAEWDDMTQAETMKGKESGKKYFKMMTTAFPDLKATTSNTWAVGDYVISEGAMQGTHKGALMGIPPTGKSINMHGLDIVQYKDGKVVRGWSYGNSAEMMQQLGMMGDKGAKGAPAKDAKPATPAKDAPKK